MAGKSVTVTVDTEAQARADEALSQALEDELQAILKGDPRMDAAQQAALDAAKKDAEAARADAAAALKDTADLKVRVDETLKAITGLTEQLKVKGDAEKATTDAETMRRATLIATLGDGLRGDAAASRAKELAGLGRVAVDQIASRIAAPAGDSTVMAMQGAGPDAKPAGEVTIRRGYDALDEKTPTWTVTQKGWENALGRKLTRHQGGRPQ